MSIARPTVISFIVKIWIDEDDDQDRTLTWHGSVIEVPEGEKRYVRELGEVTAFVAARLERLGVRVSRGGTEKGL
jgi:hypothetical protein